MSPASRDSRASGRAPGPSGRRATALACALAALPVAALVGCAGSASPPAGIASGAARAGAVADLIGNARALQAAGPAPAAIDRFRWSARASSPLGSRDEPITTWAGGQLLEFGGLVDDGSKATSAGAAFNPATGRWRRVGPVPAAAGVNPDDPSGLSLNPASAWTGRYLAVANGSVKSCPATVKATASCWTGAALYDPIANRWTMLALPKQLDGLEVSAVTWTGRDIVVGAVSGTVLNPGKSRLAVAAYNPATGRWLIITPAVPRHHPPTLVDLVADRGRLFLWSLWDQVSKTKDGFSERAGVDVLAMDSRGAWRNVTGTWPQEQLVPPPIATRDGILVSPSQIWCGQICSPPAASQPGSFTNPSTMARKTIPVGPLRMVNPTYVWTGDAIIAVDQDGAVSGTGINIQPGDMALYDPATSRWSSLPATPGHPQLSITPVWTGTALLTLTDAGHLLAFHS
jgi:hypothetical protein